MLTAEASTPAPTYRTPAISSRPWIVPSSPHGPCSSGNTTSTSPSVRGTEAGPGPTRPRDPPAARARRARHGGRLVHDRLAGPLGVGQRDGRARGVDLGELVGGGDRE